MKTPSWEPSAGALAAWLLVNRQAHPVDLWTITLASGTVLRYSGADFAPTINGNTWTLGPLLKRDRVRQTIGVSVDSMQMTVLADASVLVSGVPIVQAFAAGVFTGSTVRLERAFFDDDLVCRGVVPVFFGRMGAVRPSRSQVQAQVRSVGELLDVMVPSEVYQPGCRNTLFDAQCGLAVASFTVSGVTSAAGDVTRRIITSTSAAVIGKPTAWADIGQLTFTSGLNAGISRSVRTHVLSAGTATLTAVYGFPYAIAAADAFTLRAGCNKSKDGDCTAKFANVARFRGEPYIPAPESIT